MYSHNSENNVVLEIEKKYVYNGKEKQHRYFVMSYRPVSISRLH
jgi:hypothetical protein